MATINNYIKDLAPLSGLSELREIDLSSNEVKSIEPLIVLENIWRLSLDHNQIESIEPLLEFSELELISLRGVENLSCETISQLIEEVGENAVIMNDYCL